MLRPGAVPSQAWDAKSASHAGALQKLLSRTDFPYGPKSHIFEE